MNKDKIQSIVSEGRVKLHIFEPTQRKIWTVVGKAGEHWIDPDSNYCSCPGFYFGKINGRGTCYHLESAQVARDTDSVEKIVFSDDEFPAFLAGLVSDL